MRVVKKPEERKNEMIEAAAKLFIAQGFVHTTVAEIVASVDVAKGLFYYYFTTKDDMVKAVTEGLCAHLADRMNAIAQGEGTGVEKLEAVLRSEAWKKVTQTPFYADLCMEQHAALHTDAVTRVTEHLTPVLTGIANQAIEEAGGDTTYTQDKVRTLCHGLAQLARRGELGRAKAGVLMKDMFRL